MIERPILFSGPMIRANLTGTKTQTRRVVKWRNVTPGLNLAFSGLQAVNQDSRGWVLTSMGGSCWQERCAPTPCPYGQPGDQLWVRETWAYDDDDGARIYRADLGDGGDADAWERNRRDGLPRFRWRPSIHMPRWASRIQLGITGVRVERLQNISADDAKAEGIEWLGGCWRDYSGEVSWEGKGWTDPRDSYRTLWTSINGKTPGASWADNPWVWVVEYRKLKP